MAGLRRIDRSVDFDIVRKISYLEWATAPHNLLINTLKSKGPRRYTYPWEELQKVRKERQKYGPEISGWISNYETSLYSPDRPKH
jgi:hypothetical protein